MKLPKTIANLLFFHAAWWGFFVAAYSNSARSAVLIFIVYSLLHFYFVSENLRQDLISMVSLSVFGYLIDLFVFEGRLFFIHHKTFAETFWLLGMWWGFTSCFSYSMKALIVKPKWGMLLAFVFGPLSYWAGEKVGVLTYFKPLIIFYGLHGIFWALFFLVLYKLEKRKWV